MPRKLLVTQDGCGGCKAVKRMLADSLASGEIEEVSVYSEKGKKIADELDLEEVPECVEEFEDGTFIKCDLEQLVKEKGKR